MDIVVNRKGVRNALLIIALLLAGVVASVLVPHLLSRESQDEPALPPDALAAANGVAAFYTLDYTEPPNQWPLRVCAHTTEQGCQAVRDFFAPSVQAAVDEHRIQTFAFVEPVQVMADYKGRRIWKLEVTLTNPWNDKAARTQDVYAEVEMEGGRWLLSRILFDGNGDYLSTADHDDFYFGSGDFTIDFWVRFNALPGGYATLYSQRTDGSNYAVLWLVNSSGTYCLGWNVMSGGAQVFSMCPVVSLSANTWYHVAFVRSGNTFRLFLNGVQQGYAVTDADAWPNLTGDAALGQVSSAYFLNGWLDEFRISKGVALWTTTFTPPGPISTATPTLTPSPTPTSLATAEWETRVYTYSTAIPHAVTSVERDEEEDTYEYDANGNMTCRVEDGVSFIQTYNAENRISSITRLDSGTCASPGNFGGLWEFKYDGDGVRTTTDYTPYSGGNPGTKVTTTYYFGGLYEVTGQAVRKYYSIAGQTVAMDDGDGLKYFLTDHLGSVLAVVDEAGEVLSEQRYLPFGQVREDVGTVTETDFGFTFQRNNSYIKLYDYRSRWLDPGLGRFTQPDSIVPDLNNPQLLNRYAYVSNSPLNYNDPTGHCLANGVWIPEGVSTCEGKAVHPVYSTPQQRADADYQRQRHDNLKCQAGNETYCSYAELHPVETVTFAVASFVAMGVVEAAILEGGLANAANTALWWAQRQVWKVGWAIEDRIVEGLASVLYRIGMDTKLGKTLMEYFLKSNVHNPNSNTMVVGRYPAYVNTGNQAGYSYFSVNNPLLSRALGRAGWFERINNNAIYDAMSANKSLVVDFPGLPPLGPGLQNEIDILNSFNYPYTWLRGP